MEQSLGTESNGLVVDGSDVWDRFLTDRDRQDCAAHPVPLRELGARPALLMVDNYRRAFKPEIQDRRGGPTRTNLIASAAAACIPALATVLAAARSSTAPVVHVTKLTSAMSGVRDWAEPRGGSAEPADDYEFVDELVPEPGEAIIRKTAPSAFMHTPLLQHLMRERVDTLVVAGESTSGCIRATVVDACGFGFTVAVVRDAVFDRHEATHAMNLFDMHRKYARLLSSLEAADYLRRTAAAPIRPDQSA